MILYFLLIGFAACMVGIEFLVDFNTGNIETEIRGSSGENPHDQNALFASFERMQKKALVMVATILVVTLIVLTMFIKNISEPLQHMIHLAQEISTGDLSRTINIQADNELSDLSNLINGMSSNLQEILLLSRGVCANGQSLIDEAMQQVQNVPNDSQNQTGIGETLQRLSGEFALLNQFIVNFNFYTWDKQHHAR
jgi:methyl-accepting chemotaxis protein